MGELKKWREQQWVRIGSDGKIKGPCGTSKNKKNPDRCLPLAKAKRLSKKQLAATAKKKKASGGKKQFVANRAEKKNLYTLEQKDMDIIIRQLQGKVSKQDISAGQQNQN